MALARLASSSSPARLSRRVFVRCCTTTTTTTTTPTYKNDARERGRVDGTLGEGVTDLSEFDAPLGDLFGRLPRSQAGWDEWRLTDAQVDHYFEHGYVTGVDVLTERQCDLLLGELAELATGDHPGHPLFYEFHANQTGDPDAVLLHALGHWRITAGFHDLAFLPAISVPSSQLIGSKDDDVAVRFWHDQIFSKPPHHGGNVAWHQDYSYWTRTKAMLHMTVHVALDDQTVENGCIQFVPGSHHWSRDGMPLPITDDDFADMDSITEVLTDEEKAAFKPVPGLLKKGQASFHHPLCVHGSFPNRSSKPRRAAVINYFADGVKSDTDDPVLDGVPAISKGNQMEGQFFPVVFDPRWTKE